MDFHQKPAARGCGSGFFLIFLKCEHDSLILFIRIQCFVLSCTESYFRAAHVEHNLASDTWHIPCVQGRSDCFILHQFAACVYRVFCSFLSAILVREREIRRIKHRPRQIRLRNWEGDRKSATRTNASTNIQCVCERERHTHTQINSPGKL